jgi:hypothetical protein
MIRQGHGGWEKPRNRLIATAFSIYKRSLHAGCGHPTEKGFSGSLNGWVQVEWAKCQVCAARETAMTELGRDDPKHGREWTPIPVDHFPYGDENELFQPWRLTARPLDT